MNSESYSTLIEMLADKAGSIPNKTAIFYNEERISFGDLWKRVKRFGHHLLDLGANPGDRILIVLPNGFEFFYAFYGSQLARGVAVPVYPNSGLKRIQNFIKITGAKIIVIPTSTPKKFINSLQPICQTNQVVLTSYSECISTKDNLSEASFPEISPSDIVFLQYTSGSTGNPKGVILTHQNLLDNIRQMISGMEITTEDRFVSWLPVYHDMGLILKTMVPIYLGEGFKLLPTDLKNIDLWLRAIEKTRATFTAAPDFAYRLCLRHLEDENYDLSSLRVALNAAEPVRSTTLTKFHEAFGLRDVMVAGYGLAEATVGVSMWKPGTTNKLDHQGFVSVGKPFPGVNVKIVSQDEILPVGKIGEIAIKSIANSKGYFQNEEATSKTFVRDGYILSGDLGYLDEEGYLYIISRKKNIIKRAGETISPHEIEEIVDSFPQVRYSATIGIDRGGMEGEQVYVFAEIREHDTFSEDFLHELTVKIVDNFFQEFGFRPARVYLLKPKSIPMTHNGKIQHHQIKSLYTQGTLRENGAILYPDY